MNRRTFTKISLGTALASTPASGQSAQNTGVAFKAKFGPHENLLPTAPEGLIEQMKFALDLGFRGWEENGLRRREPKLWEQVGEFMKDHEMEMGISVISGGSRVDFRNPGKEGLAKLKKEMDLGIAMSKATGQKHFTFIPGPRRDNMPREEQIKASVDTVRRLCDMVEDHGIVFVMEPLSHKIGPNDPLLRSFADGHLLCKLVNRKSCKLLADFYHEGEIGNGKSILENTRSVWDQVGYIQYGDSPGRKEPGTGTLDYKAITKLIREKGYNGVIGMEHGAQFEGKKGLDALLAAYRKIDA